MNIRDFTRRCKEIREAHGFETTKENMLGKLMLIVTEVSEAAEFVRDDRWEMFIENGKPEGFLVELADAVIRIGDIAETLGYDLDTVLDIKLAFNESRPHLHGRTLAT